MTVQWRKSSVSTGVNDEACVEVAPVTGQESIKLAAGVTSGELEH